MQNQSKKFYIIASVIIIVAVLIVLIQNNKPKLIYLNDPMPQKTLATTTLQTLPTYTLAHIAVHKDASSCWSAINGGVYDLTSWIGQHPGGQQAILFICGKDGSDAFNGQHGGQRRPASELVGFKIGTLAN